MKKPRAVLVLVLLLVVAGMALLLYPVVSSYLAAKNHTRVIAQYNVTLADMTKEETKAQLTRAAQYNASLTGRQIRDPFIPGSGFALPEAYTSILDFNRMMAYLEIQSLGLRLPIYHGSGEAALQKGVGHMEATAFPIGGVGNHTVLTGHRGLPGAELFTNLDKLVLGDRFHIYVLDKVLAYEVDQIAVIEPSDTTLLRPVPGMDYITLVTCTPYAINSHRLLVRGHAVVPAAGAPSPVPSTPGLAILWGALFVGVAAALVAALAAGVYQWKRKRQ